MKAQGSLEYLLILAAILAIAVVVVLIANSMLGTPTDANIVNQDKYDFAVDGWEVKGYNKQIEPDDFASGNMPLFVKDGEEYSYSSDPPSETDVLIGTLTGTDTSYNVYVDNSGNYHVETPPEEENPLYSDASLIAYWKFEDNADDETGVNHGTLIDATYTASGKRGGAYDFDGITNKINVPNDASLNPEYITITAWFKPAAGSLANQKCIVQKPFTTHSQPWYQYSICLMDTVGLPKHIWIYLATGQGTIGLIEASADNVGFDYGRWNFVSMTYNGTYIKLYMDGQEVQTTLFINGSDEVLIFESGTIQAYNAILAFADYPNLADSSTYQYGGEMDEVAIFNRALTAAEIQNLYNG